MNNSSGIGGEGGVVGDHDNSIAFFVDVGEFFHDDVGVFRVKVACRFVS